MLMKSDRLYWLLALAMVAIVIGVSSYLGMKSPITQQVITGTVQGITEWLPVSSKGMIILVKTNLFGEKNTVDILLKEALLLHIGTFLATLVYFRKDILSLSKTLFKYRSSPKEDKKIFNFLLTATIATGIVAAFIYMFVDTFLATRLNVTGKAITASIGIFLIGTGVMLLKSRERGVKKEKDATILDGIVAGIAQGFAAIPGISRSGTTVASLLARKFDKTSALRLSFLMSIPAVLGANIILNLGGFSIGVADMWGLLFSFAFGILTIHTLLKVSHKINFGYFVLVFAVILVISIFI